MFLKQEKTPIVSKCVSCIDISALLVSIQDSSIHSINFSIQKLNLTSKIKK